VNDRHQTQHLSTKTCKKTKTITEINEEERRKKKQ
jgi:hypothetical protein